MDASCVVGLEAPSSSQAGVREPVNMGLRPAARRIILGRMQSRRKANMEPALSLEALCPLIKALTQQI